MNVKLGRTQPRLSETLALDASLAAGSSRISLSKSRQPVKSCHAPRARLEVRRIQREAGNPPAVPPRMYMLGQVKSVLRESSLSDL